MNILSPAGIYDLLLYVPTIDIRRGIVDIIRKMRVSRVLDVCCGTGYQLKLLADPGLFAVGIDLSPSMLSAAHRGPARARCSVQDATALAFKNGSFSLSMITFGLHEKDRATAGRVIGEMMRVTAEGGHLLITDYEISGETSPFSRRVISCIERIAGRQHHAYFREYLDNGGMRSLLPAERLIPVEERWFASHGIVTRLYRMA